MHNPFTSNYNQSSNHVSQDTELSNNAALMSTVCVCMYVGLSFTTTPKMSTRGALNLIKAGMSEPSQVFCSPRQKTALTRPIGNQFLPWWVRKTSWITALD